MAFTRVYNKIDKLRMISVGNALGLNQNPRIGNDTTQTLMITLDPTLVVSGAGVPSNFGATTYGGTTLNWRNSGSWANLDVSSSFVPTGSTIDFARLVVQTNYGSAPQPTLSECAAATVTFKVPSGQTFILQPTTTDNSGFNKVCNSYDVTTILNGVISGGIDRALGDYSVSRFPISIQCNQTGGSNGACYIGAGWGLVIYYTHPSMPFNSETLYVGDLPNDTTQTITGFYTPDAGAVNARVYTQACLSSTIENDTLRFNTTGQSAKFLSGPNNPYNPPWPRNNFLGAAICDYLGGIQYKGSFGNNNASPAAGTAGTGVKTEFTITGLQANGYLLNSTRSADIFSTGDISSLGAFGVEIQVNQAYFSSTKYSSKAIALPGETIKYTIPFTNSGGSTASNVFFTDTLPTNLTFQQNSFTIDGSTQPGYTLYNATLPNVRALNTVTVTFNAIVSATINSITTIPNTGWIGYSFISDPLLSAQRDANTTSQNILTVFKTGVTSTKLVDKSYGAIGETLSYSIVVNNPDFATYTNCVLLDTIPNGTSFVSNTLLINGVTSPQNPNTGALVGTIPQNSSVTLNFKVKVNNTIPSPNPIINNSTLTYVFNDLFGNSLPSGVVSNSTQTTIYNGSIGSAQKIVDTSSAGIGDEITYKVVLTNNGNTSSLNVVFLDTIPPDTTFVTTSLKVNNITITGGNPSPPTGVTIPDIGPGLVSTVEFKVTINTIPSPNPIVNNSSILYSYRTNPAGVIDGGASINSNSVLTYVNLATFNNGMTKTPSKYFSTVNDTLTYTIMLTNKGNVTANNLYFWDTIPNDTSFVPGSIKLDGVTKPGTVAWPSSFYIGTIAAGQSVSLTFDVLVNTIPSPNPIVNVGVVDYNYTANPLTLNDKAGSNISNQAVTTVNYASLSNMKMANNTAYATCKDSIKYTVSIPNNGNTLAYNVRYIDTMPNGVILDTDSIYINGVKSNQTNLDTGITLPNINPGETVIVEYLGIVTCQ